jgi:hypothetical protein
MLVVALVRIVGGMTCVPAVSHCLGVDVSRIGQVAAVCGQLLLPVGRLAEVS